MLWNRFTPDYVLHQKVYIALLRGILAHGQKQRVARRARISQVYLSNILDADHHPPSDAVADRLVAALPSNHQQRDLVRYHMALARQHHNALTQEISYFLLHDQAERLVAELQTLHHQATFNRDDPSQYQLIITVGERLLPRLSPEHSPLAYAQTCLVLHDAYAVRNRHSHSLYLMLKAHDVLERTNPLHVSQPTQLDRLLLNVLYALSVTYRNIGVPDLAARACQEANLYLNKRHDPALDWAPHILRDQLQVLGHTRKRFAISEAEGLVRLVEKSLVRANTTISDLFFLLTQKALLEAYRNHSIRLGSVRSRKKGLALAQYLAKQVHSDRSLGLIHRAVILRSITSFHAHIGDQGEVEIYARQAWKLATDAGLSHQQHQLQQAFSTYLSED